MAKYRIVKKKHYENLYMVEKRFLGIFWVNVVGDYFSLTLRECEIYIETELMREKVKKENPRNTVVKSF